MRIDYLKVNYSNQITQFFILFYQLTNSEKILVNFIKFDGSQVWAKQPDKTDFFNKIWAGKICYYDHAYDTFQVVIMLVILIRQ